MIPDPDKFRSFTIALLAATLVLFLFYGCERDDDLVAIVSFEITEPVLTEEGIEVGANLVANREIGLENYGIVYNTSLQPDINDNTVPGHDLETSWILDSYSVEFKSLITGLSSGTTYYFRAFITTRTGTAYSQNQIDFTP